MKKLLIVMTLLFASSTSAQYPTTSFTAGGNITAASASCLATNCVPIKLPASATTLTVGVTGTFSATLAVEESQDGGRTWTSAGSNITGAGTTSFTITAFSDFRVRASAYVSGNAGVNILVSASTNSGGGGGGGGITQVSSLPGTCTPTSVPVQLTASPYGVYAPSGGSSCSYVLVGGPISGNGLVDASSPNYGYKTVDGSRGAYIAFDATTTNTLQTITTQAGDPTFCDGAGTPCTGSQLSSVGMLIEVTSGGIGQSQPSSTLVLAVDTIASVTSAHIAVTTTKTANASCASTCFVMWGPDNTPSQTAAWTAATGGTGPCLNFLIPSTPTIVQSSFGSTSTVCRFSTSGAAESEMTVSGWSMFNSVYMPTSAFNFTTQCVGTGGACFFGELGVNYVDMGLFGLAYNNTGSHPNTCAMFNSKDNHWMRVSMTGWGANEASGGLTGLCMTNSAGGTNLFDVTVDGVGNLPIDMNGPLHIVMYDIFAGDSLGFVASGVSGIQVHLHTGSTWETYGSDFEGANAGSTGIVLVDAGARWHSYGDGMNFASIAGNGPQIRGVAYFNGLEFFLSAPATSNGVFIDGGTVYIQNSVLVGGASGNCVVTGTSARYFDQGGVAYSTCLSSINNASGTVYLQDSVTGASFTAGAMVPSGGWGASATITAATGATKHITFTLTNTGAGQAANPTLVYTFPTPFIDVANVSCTLSQVGGTQAVLATTALTQGTGLTKTSVTFTYAGTPTVNLTEFYHVDCYDGSH